MGTQHASKFSATVAAYLSVEGHRVDIAKMNHEYLTLANVCEFPPETEAQLNIIVDDRKSRQIISLVDGVSSGQTEVRYSILAPF